MDESLFKMTMKEYTTQFGRKIYVFENVIPKDICEQLILKIPKHGVGNFDNDHVLPKYLYELYSTHCVPSPIKFSGFVPKLSCGASREFIPLHVDQNASLFDEWKVLFYLNTVVNGGTIFREGGQDIVIENSQGSVVLFDIRIPHLGNPSQSNEIKYTMGFRPLTASAIYQLQTKKPKLHPWSGIRRH